MDDFPLTDVDYIRSALAWALCDGVTREQMFIATCEAENGAQFDAAIEAAVRFNELLATT